MSCSAICTTSLINLSIPVACGGKVFILLKSCLQIWANQMQWVYLQGSRGRKLKKAGRRRLLRSSSPSSLRRSSSAGSPAARRVVSVHGGGGGGQQSRLRSPGRHRRSRSRSPAAPAAPGVAPDGGGSRSCHHFQDKHDAHPRSRYRAPPMVEKEVGETLLYICSSQKLMRY